MVSNFPQMRKSLQESPGLKGVSSGTPAPRSPCQTQDPPPTPARVAAPPPPGAPVSDPVTRTAAAQEGGGRPPLTTEATWPCIPSSNVSPLLLGPSWIPCRYPGCKFVGAAGGSGSLPGQLFRVLVGVGWLEEPAETRQTISQSWVPPNPHGIGSEC